MKIYVVAAKSYSRNTAGVARESVLKGESALSGATPDHNGVASERMLISKLGSSVYVSLRGDYVR